MPPSLSLQPMPPSLSARPVRLRHSRPSSSPSRARLPARLPAGMPSRRCQNRRRPSCTRSTCSSRSSTATAAASRTSSRRRSASSMRRRSRRTPTCACRSAARHLRHPPYPPPVLRNRRCTARQRHLHSCASPSLTLPAAPPPRRLQVRRVVRLRQAGGGDADGGAVCGRARPSARRLRARDRQRAACAREAVVAPVRPRAWLEAAARPCVGGVPLVFGSG